MITWKDDTQIIIPSVISIPERADTIKNLLIDLATQCAGTSVTIIPQIKREQDYSPRIAFEAIHKGLQSLSSPWIFYIEDDVCISKKFGQCALEALNDCKEDCGAISFFSINPRDPQMLRTGVRLYKANDPFVFAQCVAIKLEVAAAWREMILNWWDGTHYSMRQSPDICLGDCCKSLNKNIMIYLPSLVQHIRIPSAFGHTAFPYSMTYSG
jgi:hypothetical protein